MAGAKSLYETDFVEWTARTAELLRKRRFDEVDLAPLIEEVEELGLNWKHAVRSQLTRMLKLLVKMRIQPERNSASWRESITGAQSEIEMYIGDAPSLRSQIASFLPQAYRSAVRQALVETRMEAKARQLALPKTCPYSADELLKGSIETLVAKLD